MSHQSDDFTQLEDLLRSVREELAYPDGPDVRRAVRERLNDLRQSDAPVETTLLNSRDGLEQTSQPVARIPGVERDRPKSLTRQLLEMAAAVIVLVGFTGVMVLVFRDQTSQDSTVPGTDVPTEEATPGAEQDDGAPALDGATPVEFPDRSDPPYPVPENCDVTEFVGPYERAGVPGFWLIGSGIDLQSQDTVLYEGNSHLFYLQTEASVNSDEDVRADGQRLDADSDATPNLWVQHAAGMGTHRAFLRLPEPGCWEIELSTDTGERLEAIVYAYPGWEREIRADRDLSVLVGRVSEFTDEFQQRYSVHLSLRHAQTLTGDPLPIDELGSVVWMADGSGTEYRADTVSAVFPADVEDPEMPEAIPVAPESPRILGFVFVLPPDADNPELTIRLPEDHPDPSMPDAYRVSLEALMERQAEGIIPSVSPDQEHENGLSSTQDVSVEIADDQILAVAAQRWIDGRRVMTVIDLDGDVLWEFDQIPNIEVDGFASTIVADVSPDGRSVAYQHNDDDGSDIFIWTHGEDQPRQLTFTGDNYQPVWSPDGASIAFLSDRAHDESRHRHQRSEVFVMDSDGEHVTQLTETPYGAGQIKWSYDGSMIAFASPGFHSAHLIDDGERDEYPYELYVVDVVTGEQWKFDSARMESLAGFALSAQPWLTDGGGVLFERDGQVFLADVDSGGVAAVEAIPAGEEGHQRSASTSPDGRQIAFGWSRDGFSSIGIADLDSGGLEQLTSDAASNRGWSPDGALHAITTGAEPPDGWPDGLMHAALSIVSMDDGSVSQVATGIAHHDVRWVVVPADLLR